MFYYKDNFARIKKNLGEQKKLVLNILIIVISTCVLNFFSSTVHAAKAIGKEWKALSEKDKEQWNKRAMEDKKRYEREVCFVG